MKKKIIISLASAIAFLAVFVAQASAASACFWWLYDPQLPEGLE